VKKTARKRGHGGRRATPSSLTPGAESEVMTLRDLAEYLHCSYNTAWRLAKHGDMPSFMLGGRQRFLKSEVDRWIAKGGGRRRVKEQ